MTQEDPPQLASLWQEQLSLIAQTDSRGRSSSALAEWLTGMSTLLADPRAAAFTALGDDQGYAGYVVGWEPPVGLLPAVGSRVGIIGDLVVDMHRYRGGVARALVLALRTEFAVRGVDRLIAFSARRHVTGQAFWRSLGAVEWIDGFWLKGAD